MKNCWRHCYGRSNKNGYEHHCCTFSHIFHRNTHCCFAYHYNDVIMDTMASQITSLTIVCAAVYSRHRSKKTSKLRVTGLYAGNSPVTGEFPAQRASNAGNVSIWWRHHGNTHILVMIYMQHSRKDFNGFSNSESMHFWLSCDCSNDVSYFSKIIPNVESRLT